MNPFPAIKAPHPLIFFFFFSNLLNTDEVTLVNNLGKTYLVKGIARSISV